MDASDVLEHLEEPWYYEVAVGRGTREMWK